MDYKETLQKNLKRVETLVDDNLQMLDGGIPLFSWIEISPVDICNRKCVFCPKADTKNYPNNNLHMSEVLYEKMACELELLNFQGTIMIAGYGEPLLHKRLLPMVLAFSKVANTEITTNGDFLTVDKIENLMSAGISKIIVSLYDGQWQIEKFRRLFEKANFPEELFILRDRWYREDDDFGVKLTNRAGTVMTGRQPKVQVEKKCYYPHYSMMIDWNGDAYLCTQDWNRKVKTGNVMQSSMLEVWTSNNLKRYRIRLNTGIRDLSPCCKCNAEGTLHGWNHSEAWEKYYGKGNDDVH